MSWPAMIPLVRQLLMPVTNLGIDLAIVLTVICTFMKVEILVLGLVVFVFAISSAFMPTKLAPVNVYAEIKRQGYVNCIPEIVCNNEATCATTGSVICKVQVWIDLPMRMLKLVTAYRDAACTIPFKNSTPVVIYDYDPAGVSIVDACD